MKITPPSCFRSVVLALGVAAISPAHRAGSVQVERNVAVPMRDGVMLRADVYRPEGPGPRPVLVLRTPYGKEGGNPVEAYVKAG
jgi:predicted acyl esterase